MKKYLSLIVVSVLALGVNNANAAEATGQGTATATILAASGISQTQELDFGNVLKTAAHSVVMSTEGVRSGTEAYLVGGGTPQEGKFTITGQDGQDIKISVPSTITLENGSSELKVSNVTMKIGTGAEQAAAQSVETTITGGSLALAVGGTLNVTTDAVVGDYKGNYTVTISY